MIMRLAVFGMLAFASAAMADDTPYGSCSQRAQYYQERYESQGQVADMVCMQKALQRDMQDPGGYSCPGSAQHYQTAYEQAGRVDDMICMQEALKRELQ